VEGGEAGQHFACVRRERSGPVFAFDRRARFLSSVFASASSLELLFFSFSVA
jgi:hypothetical protein